MTGSLHLAHSFSQKSWMTVAGLHKCCLNAMYIMHCIYAVASWWIMMFDAGWPHSIACHARWSRASTVNLFCYFRFMYVKSVSGNCFPNSLLTMQKRKPAQNTLGNRHRTHCFPILVLSPTKRKMAQKTSFLFHLILCQIKSITWQMTNAATRFILPTTPSMSNRKTEHFPIWVTCTPTKKTVQELFRIPMTFKSNRKSEVTVVLIVAMVLKGFMVATPAAAAVMTVVVAVAVVVMGLMWWAWWLWWRQW